MLASLMRYSMSDMTESFVCRCLLPNCNGSVTFELFENYSSCNVCKIQFHRDQIKEPYTSKTSICMKDCSCNSADKCFCRDMILPTFRYKTLVKVNGLSSYHCKLISKFLTYHGFDRRYHRARLWSTAQSVPIIKNKKGTFIFDCGALGHFAYLIDPKHIDLPGFGRDCSGSSEYLKEIFLAIRNINQGEERLIPLHVDDDGNSLTTAISRALVGREIFWHPLKTHLKVHLQKHLERYQELLEGIIEYYDWPQIVKECHPEYVPKGIDPIDLQHVHIFAFAQILKRPIILFDSYKEMQSYSNRSGLFLPIMLEPAECLDAENNLRKPICLGWTDFHKGHYIPMVAVKGRPLPAIPKNLLPRVWGASQSNLERYIEFQDNCCFVGGSISIKERFLISMVTSMDEIFRHYHNVSVDTVAGFFYYSYRGGRISHNPTNDAIENCRKLVEDGLLFECINCGFFSSGKIGVKYFKTKGALYNLAVKGTGTLRANKLYWFKHFKNFTDLICKYDQDKDQLIPQFTDYNIGNSSFHLCCRCSTYSLRQILNNGHLVYLDGDQVPIEKANGEIIVRYFWDNKIVQFVPRLLTITIDYNEKEVTDLVSWFDATSQKETEDNAFVLAHYFAKKNLTSYNDTQFQTIINKILHKARFPCKYPRTSNFSASFKHHLVLGGVYSPNKPFVRWTSVKPISFEAEEKLSLKKIKRRYSRSRTSDRRQRLELFDDENRFYSTTVEHKNPITFTIKSMDGRKIEVQINEKVTYKTFSNIITENFNIPPKQQLIKKGFPPLTVLFKKSIDEILSIKNGDRFLVEIVNDGASCSKDP